MIVCEDVVKVARLEAARVYGALTSYRISLALEAAGWHVDYEPKNPRLNGGGAHYVVEPVNGTIVSKRYEQ
jgi:hypothetical protein